MTACSGTSLQGSYCHSPAASVVVVLAAQPLEVLLQVVEQVLLVTEVREVEVGVRGEAAHEPLQIRAPRQLLVDAALEVAAGHLQLGQAEIDLEHGLDDPQQGGRK